MKKERQIGIRVGVPAFFALELEDVYRHSEGAHHALAFPDFVGLLVGLGLEAYRKGKPLPEEARRTPREEERPEGDTLNLFDIDRRMLPDMFKEYEEAIEKSQEEKRVSLRLVHAGGFA
jgi:hypothetical protein